MQKLIDDFLSNKIDYKEVVQNEQSVRDLFMFMCDYKIDINTKFKLILYLVYYIFKLPTSGDITLIHPMFWSDELIKNNLDIIKNTECDVCKKVIFSVKNDLNYWIKSSYDIRSILWLKFYEFEADVILNIDFPFLATIEDLKSMIRNGTYSFMDFVINEINNIDDDIINLYMSNKVWSPCINSYNLYQKIKGKIPAGISIIYYSPTAFLLEDLNTLIQLLNSRYNRIRIKLKFYAIRSDITLELCKKHPVLCMFYDVNKLCSFEEFVLYENINVGEYYYSYYLNMTEETFLRLQILEKSTSVLTCILFNVNISDELMDKIVLRFKSVFKVGYDFDEDRRGIKNTFSWNCVKSGDIIFPVSLSRYLRYKEIFDTNIRGEINFTVLDCDIKYLLDVEYAIDSKYWKPIIFDQIQGFYLLKRKTLVIY
jgi:hypothetical protein